MPCNDNTAPTGRGKTSWKHSANENPRTLCLHNPPDFLFPSVKEFSSLFLLGPCTWLAAAAAKSLQSCPTLNDPMDCSLPGSSIHGIFQARVLEWDATAFPGTWLAMVANFNSLLISNKPTLAGEITGSVFFFSQSVQSLSHIRLFATPWTAALQASLSFTISQSLLKLMSIRSVMPSNHPILCCPLLLLPSIFPSIRVFSNESVFCIRWPKYWSFSISPSSEY